VAEAGRGCVLTGSWTRTPKGNRLLVLSEAGQWTFSSVPLTEPQGDRNLWLMTVVWNIRIYFYLRMLTLNLRSRVPGKQMSLTSGQSHREDFPQFLNIILVGSWATWSLCTDERIFILTAFTFVVFLSFWATVKVWLLSPRAF
jgi:hypothetical protein